MGLPSRKEASCRRRTPLSGIFQRVGLLVLEGSASDKSIRQKDKKFTENLSCVRCMLI